VAVVLPTDHVRGRTFIAEHLEHLRVPLGLTLMVAADHETVPGLGTKDRPACSHNGSVSESAATDIRGGC
jgi:hypothetical protein